MMIACAELRVICQCFCVLLREKASRLFMCACRGFPLAVICFARPVTLAVFAIVWQLGLLAIPVSERAGIALPATVLLVLL
jgi:hypothetical protein